MTPLERASEIVEKKSIWYPWLEKFGERMLVEERLVEAIAKAIEAAVAAEREACAKLVDGDCLPACHGHDDLLCPYVNPGATIRARSAPVSKPDDVDRPADHFGTECNCEFDPRHADPGEESVLFHRKCQHCGHGWASLHCPHDGYQNPCPNCDQRTSAADHPSNWTTGPIGDLGGEG